jgi:hypothetical protein
LREKKRKNKESDGALEKLVPSRVGVFEIFRKALLFPSIRAEEDLIYFCSV